MSGLTTINNPGNSLSLPAPNDATLTIQRNSTNVATFTANDADNVTANITDNDTTYSAGSGLSLSGTTFAHSDTSSQASVNNSGSNFIQDITLDTYGHVTGITSAAAGGSGNNTSTTAVGAYAMVAATNPTNTNVGTSTSFSGNSSVYQYGGVTAGVNNYSYSLAGSGATMARNGNIPSGTWHFRGAGGQNTGRCTLCQRTA